jgi:Sec-independent protein translocase protein TatA
VYGTYTSVHVPFLFLHQRVSRASRGNNLGFFKREIVEMMMIVDAVASSSFQNPLECKVYCDTHTHSFIYLYSYTFLLITSHHIATIMFDISWGELAVLGAVGVAVTGKRDLPKACRFVGQQLGRVVGLLQGARARADRFAHHNELRALQNELRSGLRELDQVKTELAVAASSQGVMGRGLGATTRSANRTRPPHNRGVAGVGVGLDGKSWKTPSSLSTPLQQAVASPSFSPSPTSTATSNNIISSFNAKKKNNTGENDTHSDNNKNSAVPLSLSDFDFTVADSVDDEETSNNPNNSTATSEEHSSVHQQQELSPAGQSERAVMEEEWTKQGIGFRAQAERGSWIGDSEGDIGSIGGSGFSSSGSDGAPSVVDTTRATGSELLEHLERQCLIFDQYDRVVGEQEAEMEKRVERIQNKRKEKRGNDDDGKNQ